MYVILGATGNTGKIVAETLLDGGQKVRVVGRSKDRLAGFTILGAEAFEANLTDSAALTKAFTGARAVYALVPPNPASPDYRAEQDAISSSIARALEAAGVTQCSGPEQLWCRQSGQDGAGCRPARDGREIFANPEAKCSFPARRIFHGKPASASRDHQEFWNDGWASARGSRTADDRDLRHRRSNCRCAGQA